MFTGHIYFLKDGVEYYGNKIEATGYYYPFAGKLIGPFETEKLAMEAAKDYARPKT